VVEDTGVSGWGTPIQKKTNFLILLTKKLVLFIWWVGWDSGTYPTQK
jgi:hypothetical protein